MSTEHNNAEIFIERQALTNGHFLLSSGKHSDTYIQCARILEQPHVTAQLAEEIATPWKGKHITCVAGPAFGGIILAYEVARVLNCRAIFFERPEGTFTLRRGFTIHPDEKILLAEDVVTTAVSSNEVIDKITEYGGQVAGVVSLVNRNGGNPFTVDFNSALTIVPPLYDPVTCPLCADDIPIGKPGSRGNET